MELILSGSCALLVFLIVVMLCQWSMRDRLRIRRRMEKLVSDTEQKKTNDKKNEQTRLMKGARGLMKGKRFQRLAADLSFSGILLRPEEYVIFWVLVTLGPALIAVLLQAKFFTVLGLMAFCAGIPPLLLKRAIHKRMQLLDKQLVDVLMIMGNCLRAGFTFQQAIQSIVEEMPDPVAREFARVQREIRLGLSLESALGNLVERVPNKDLELIVSAVLIQRQVGGNLAEILDNIAGTIKERLRMKGEIKVITASGRMSGMVIGLLPAFLMGILMMINPDYIGMFFKTTIGTVMLSVASGMEIIGFLIVNKIVKVKY